MPSLRAVRRASQSFRDWTNRLSQAKTYTCGGDAADELATCIMMRLRRWFLAPTTSMLAVLFFAPMVIILAYSFLMRGVYGGVTGEWTIENYKRLFDPLYGAILARTLALSALATLLCLTLGFPLAFFISRSSKTQESCTFSL